jgi:hypothetical protein
MELSDGNSWREEGSEGSGGGGFIERWVLSFYGGHGKTILLTRRVDVGSLHPPLGIWESICEVGI